MNAVVLLNLIGLWIVVLLLLLRALRKREAEEEGERSAPPPAAAQNARESLLLQEAPPFVAFLLAGNEQHPVSLAQYHGVPTLFLFLSTSCAHCRILLPEMERVGHALLRRGGKVAYVFAEEAEGVAAYAQRFSLSLPILLAPRQVSAFIQTYNRAGGTPAFVAVSREGIVTHEGVVNPHSEGWRTLVTEWQIYPAIAKTASLYD
jgi:thiol-disulfide isomerase/thioredoxin